MFRWSIPLILSAYACKGNGGGDDTAPVVDDSGTPPDDTGTTVDDSGTPPDDTGDDSGTPIDTAHQAPDTIGDVATTIWYGNPSDRVGGTLANVGDVTGDGANDLLIGAPLASASGNPFFGRAYVVTPDSTEEEVDLDAGSALPGSIFLAHLSWDVGTEIDVNDDGQDDLLLGSFWSSLTGALDGAGDVYFGPIGPKTLGPDVRFLSDEPHPEAGFSIASLGDMSQDGVDDFAVGSPGSGTIYFVEGDDSWSGVWALNGAFTRIRGAGTDLGEDLLGGDWSGDGVNDVVASASLTVDGPCGVFLFEGPIGNNDRVIEDADFALHPNTLVMAVTVADAHDTDGDGNVDLAVGLPNDGQGSVQLYTTPFEDKPAATFVGSPDIGQLGKSMDGLGDVDGDGFGEIAIGAPDPLYGDHRGAVVVMNGPFTGTTTVEPGPWIGEAGYDELGWAVAGLGDADGDGDIDFAVGAPEHGQDTGAVYLLSGWK